MLNVSSKTSPYTILMLAEQAQAIPLLKQILEHDQYLVKTACSLSETLELLDTLNPDLILADLDLPGLDDLELIRQVKHHLPQTMLVFLCDRLDTLDILSGLELGAEDYLLKSCRPKDVLNRIRQLLARPDVLATFQEPSEPLHQAQGLYHPSLSERLQQPVNGLTLWLHLRNSQPA
jgi:two-component system response regulator RstA